MTTKNGRANPLLDPLVPGIRSHALITAVSCGFLEVFNEGQQSAAEAAERSGIDPAGAERLAALLASAGYLEREGSRYRLSGASSMCLVSGGAHQLRHWIRFCRYQLQAVEEMERVLRGGEPADLLGFVRKDDDPLLFQRAMAETAAPIAEWIAGEVPVAGRARAMLDIGGSHGLYSAALCRHHPPMRADILELPEMIPSSRRVAQEWGAEEYVSYIEGDVKTLRLSGRYDLVFLGNILHHFSEERVTSLLETLAAHLSSGGTAVVWDLQTPDESADEVSAAFSLFFYLSSGSGCHSEERMREMLRTAGFSGVRSHRPPGPSTHLLYTARAGGGQET